MIGLSQFSMTGAVVLFVFAATCLLRPRDRTMQCHQMLVGGTLMTLLGGAFGGVAGVVMAALAWAHHPKRSTAVASVVLSALAGYGFMRGIGAQTPASREKQMASILGLIHDAVLSFRQVNGDFPGSLSEVPTLKSPENQAMLAAFYGTGQPSTRLNGPLLIPPWRPAAMQELYPPGTVLIYRKPPPSSEDTDCLAATRPDILYRKVAALGIDGTVRIVPTRDLGNDPGLCSLLQDAMISSEE